MQQNLSDNGQLNKPITNKLSSSKTIPKFWKLFSFNNSIRSSFNSPNINSERKKGQYEESSEQQSQQLQEDQFHRRLYLGNRQGQGRYVNKRLSAFFLNTSVKHDHDEIYKRKSCIVMSQHQISADLMVTPTDDQENTDNTSLSRPEQQERFSLQNQQQNLDHSEYNDTCSKNNLSSYEPPASEVEMGHQQEQEEEPWHIVNGSFSISRSFQRTNAVSDIDHNNSSASSVLHSSVSSCSVTLDNNKSSSIIEDEKEKKEKAEKGSPNMVTQDEARVLREELEKEKKNVAALQNQKEATTKDLDYFGRIVEKLTEEKSSLSQRLDLEKMNVKHKEMDISILLKKVKIASDDSREKSLEANKCKQELNDFRLQVDKDRNTYEEQLRQKDEKIDHLSSQLGKAEDQVQALKFAMKQLVKTTTAVAATSSLSSSKSIIIDTTATEKRNSEQQREQQMGERLSSSQIASRKCSGTLAKFDSTNASSVSANSQMSLLKKPSTTVSKIDSDVLDRELRDLTQEKEQILLQYSKIPISGGSRQSRRQKEQLEDQLDKVDSQLSRVKQKIRTRGH
ncbi:hypothetical protein BDC45DRAFT_530436 [Circinella umbellata]|nr:hypothetical protein BDC45DRAFT_530436 [Circinella umbellata]